MNYAFMKPGELKQLRKLVADWDEKPLSEAEFEVYCRALAEVTTYDYEVRAGHPASERVCSLCDALVSQCCC